MLTLDCYTLHTVTIFIPTFSMLLKVILLSCKNNIEVDLVNAFSWGIVRSWAAVNDSLGDFLPQTSIGVVHRKYILWRYGTHSKASAQQLLSLAKETKPPPMNRDILRRIDVHAWELVTFYFFWKNGGWCCMVCASELEQQWQPWLLLHLRASLPNARMHNLFILYLI